MKNNISYIIALVVCLICFSGCVPDSFKDEKRKEKAREWTEKARSQYGALWTASLDSAIYHYPEGADPYYSKSVRQFRRGDMIEGIRNLDKAAKLDPFNYLNYLGFVHMLYLRDYERAEEIFQIAIDNKIYADIIIAGSAYMRLGIVQYKLGKYEQAIKSFDEEVRRSGEKNAYNYTFVYRGIAKYLSGDKQGALQDFDKAIELWDKCPEAYYRKALVLEEMGDKKMACKMAQKALLNKSFISENPHRSYVDQLHLSDIEELFDRTCR